MAENENGPGPVPSVEEIQKSWHDLNLKVRQMDAELTMVEQENKVLRSLLERMVEHRQKSHGEMVSILTSLVTKLPINDIGVVVSRLVEHNAQVNEVCAALAKGKMDDSQLQPVILKVLEKTKDDLAAFLKATVAELLKLDAPFEAGLLESLLEKPDKFHSPAFIRANRAFVKGQVPRERIVKEFGEEALVFFKDITTDSKLNPHPKPEEIMLAFQNDFETLLAQNPNAVSAKRNELTALQKKVQASRAATEMAQAQRNTFLQLCFAGELLYYYLNQNTESPDVVFAQRLPPLVEQIVITGERDVLDEKPVKQAEDLLAFIIKPDHRHVATLREIAVDIQHVGHAAAHAGREIAPRRPEYHHASTGHVLATVVADRLDDRAHATVANAKPFAGHPANIRLAARRAVERDVADDNVLLGHERRTLRRIDDDLAAAEPLADVVIRIALQRERHALGQERAETLAGAALEMQLDRVFR